MDCITLVTPYIKETLGYNKHENILSNKKRDTRLMDAPVYIF